MRPFAIAACMYGLLAACEARPPEQIRSRTGLEFSNTPQGGIDVRQVPGQPIGTITTVGDIAVLELEPGVIAEANPFDLVGRTLRFVPDGAGYRVENLPLVWESDLGTELAGGRGGRGGRGGARVGGSNAARAGGRQGAAGGQLGRGARQGGAAGASDGATANVTLTRFSFPFSGSTWARLTVNPLGTITFGGGYGDLGLPRFIHMQTLGPMITGKIPLIAAFMKQRMSGTRYVNEREDRLVVTWDLTEPSRGNQDMTFEPTPHRFQAVLHADGRIDLSYEVMTAVDGLVGVFPVPQGGAAAAEPIDLSALGPTDPPGAIVYEAFHHYGLPRPESLACTVIETFGDRFDFMIWYSDFRVDDQEAGTRSVGDIPLNVGGLGPRMDVGRRSADFCSEGRLQVTWFQPVYIGSNQAQPQAPDGRWADYDNAIAQIAHELGHRWSTRTRAIVDGDTIELRGEHVPWAMSGAAHWPGNLHTPVPHPYHDGPEASTMGGSNWQDNGDGTYTLLDRGSMVPADGFSYLELYLMGLLPASEVPPFFLLENTQFVERTEDGRQIYTAGSRMDITIDDVIAHNGPRVPAFEDAPKEFTTAFVAVVLPGQQPSPELLERTDAIRRGWMNYWSRVTGGVGTMDTSLGAARQP